MRCTASRPAPRSGHKGELTKLYGSPDFTKEQDRIFKWTWPREKVMVMLYFQTRFQRSTVSFDSKGI